MPAAAAVMTPEARAFVQWLLVPPCLCVFTNTIDTQMQSQLSVMIEQELFYSLQRAGMWHALDGSTH